MNETEGRIIAQEWYNKDEAYIMLSVTKANMITGQSVPYVGRLEDGSGILFVFDSYEGARHYMDRCHYEVLDNTYTIARILKEDENNNLYSVFNTALQLGIDKVDFNPGMENVFGCNISWFFEVNNLSVSEVSMLLSKEEYERMLNNNEKPMLRFNQLPIYGFEPRYMVSDERAKEILGHVFAEVETYGELQEIFLNQESLHENCFVADYINTRMIPSAQQENKQEHVEWFRNVDYALGVVVWNRLFEQPVYTLTDRQSGELMIRNESMYVIYTDMYKYMGQFGYRRLDGKDELMELVKAHGIKRLVVTDGPHGMVMLGENIFNEN